MIGYDFLTINYAACIGIAFLLIFLFTNHTLNKRIHHIFLTLVLLEFLELVLYNLELWTATFSEPVIARTVLSAMGYTIRIMLICLILLLALRNRINRKQIFLLSIPMIISTLIVFSAFFTDIAFSYTPSNVFVRGPLGYTPHVTLLVYLTIILASAIKDIRIRNSLESTIVFACVTVITFSMVAEAAWSVRSIGRTSIVLSTVFYYMFFQTQIYRETIDTEQKRSENLEQKVKIDAATGLLNKNAFFDVAAMTINNHPDGNMAFLLLDLDDFKNVNDRLGHLLGDKVIKNTAKKLQNAFRNVDILGRFGGDEFCALLPGIPKGTLYERLDEVLLALQEEYTNGKDSITVTGSIGVIYCANANNSDLMTLFDLADRALYQSKTGGRNRYVVEEYK